MAQKLGELIDKISIHALREEGDWDCYEVLAEDPVISIHALREEGDRSSAGIRPRSPNFYPRPP